MRSIGRPRKQILKPDELVQLLKQDVKPVDIARMYGVSPAAVTQAINSLSKPTLLDVVTSRVPVPPVEVERPRTDRSIDVMGVVLGVHERLERLQAFLESPEAAGKLKLGQRLQLQLAALERSLKWAQTFLDTNKHLLDLMGVDIWMQELKAVLAEVDPALKERLKERVQARGLVRALPA